MNDQETIENDKLAAKFQDLLIHELQSRGVHFTKATAENFSNVNIDVHIYIEDWGLPIFMYIGIGRLKHRILSNITLEDYVKGYVELELRELKASVEYTIKENSDLLARDTQWTESYKRSLEERLQSARKIASWLT